MSPKEFEDCVAAGGKVRYMTKNCPDGYQRKVCYRGGKGVVGHLERKANPAKAVKR